MVILHSYANLPESNYRSMSNDQFFWTGNGTICSMLDEALASPFETFVRVQRMQRSVYPGPFHNCVKNLYELVIYVFDC